MQKLILAATLLAAILGADIATKRWALDALNHYDTVHVFGGMVPFTLAFNKGIAFGIDIPDVARWIVIGASVFVVFVLVGMLRKAENDDYPRIGAIAFVCAGALGNLIDRVRWDRGVVDFIGPLELGFMQWPIFNIADMAITSGAVVLALSLWREEARAAAAAPAQAFDSAD